MRIEKRGMWKEKYLVVLTPVYERTKLIFTELQGCLLNYARLMLGLSPQRKKVYCGCSKARCYGAYLYLKRRKKKKIEGILYWGA